jgi:hypothetical protein
MGPVGLALASVLSNLLPLASDYSYCLCITVHLVALALLTPLLGPSALHFGTLPGQNTQMF